MMYDHITGGSSGEEEATLRISDEKSVLYKNTGNAESTECFVSVCASGMHRITTSYHLISVLRVFGRLMQPQHGLHNITSLTCH